MLFGKNKEAFVEYILKIMDTGGAGRKHLSGRELLNKPVFQVWAAVGSEWIVLKCGQPFHFD